MLIGTAAVNALFRFETGVVTRIGACGSGWRALMM